MFRHVAQFSGGQLPPISLMCQSDPSRQPAAPLDARDPDHPAASHQSPGNYHVCRINVQGEVPRKPLPTATLVYR
jgi:hypothetical protein